MSVTIPPLRDTLEEALERFRALGADVAGEVGDTSPFLAVRDCLLADGTYDGIILSTLPLGVSRWLKQDLVHRLERPEEWLHPNVLAF